MPEADAAELRRIVRLDALAFEARAPRQLAQFWAHALGWDAREVDGDVVEVLPTDVTTFRLVFRAGPADKAGQNPIHFDLTSSSLDDQRDTVAELVGMGARHVDVGQSAEDAHVVLADPEGNEFCVIEPDNRFLSSCPRLGAVNCDGTKALGYFFSEALGWRLVWDENEETAVQAPSGTGPKVTWSGPPLMPKSARERIHLHLTGAHALDGLLALGASRRTGDGHACPGAIALSDPDGNQVCVVEPASSRS